jgi:hypothetical protein
MFHKHFDNGSKRLRNDTNGESVVGVESNKRKRRQNNKQQQKTTNNRETPRTSSKRTIDGVQSNSGNDDKNRRKSKLTFQEKAAFDSSSMTTKKNQRRPPTEEAIDLSEQLKSLSREKNLDGALHLYWDTSNDTIRDGHHACIMIDIAARCGKIVVRARGGWNDSTHDRNTPFVLFVCVPITLGSSPNNSVLFCFVCIFFLSFFPVFLRRSLLHRRGKEFATR